MFVAPNIANIDAARQNAKRERAWQSILNDADLRDNLTRAQTSDAETQARRSREALLRSIRSAWVNVLYPAPPEAEDGAANAGAGYVMHSARLINRGGAKSIPEAVWDKAGSDRTVIAEMGLHNLARSLEPVWPADRPHTPIETIRDWFASYVYMPRLRDEATLDGALQLLVTDFAEPYVYASAFDEDTGTCDGAIEGLTADLRTRLLVRREAVPPRETEETVPDGPDGPGPKPPERDDTPPEPSPRRFFASIPVDPDRAGLERPGDPRDRRNRRGARLSEGCGRYREGQRPRPQARRGCVRLRVLIRECPSDIGGGWTRERPSYGHVVACACRWPPCGCTTAAGAAMPFRRVRPWRERPPLRDAWYGIGEGRHGHAHAILRRGSLPTSDPFQEGCSAPLRGGGSPVLPTVQPVCLRYRRGPGADPRRTPDRGLPGTSSHESAFRIPGDVGMWESPDP